MGLDDASALAHCLAIFSIPECLHSLDFAAPAKEQDMQESGFVEALTMVVSHCSTLV